MQQNPYLPFRIDDIITETEDKNLKTFKFAFLNPEDENRFDYKAGQFAELSIAGKGEIPIGIASSPTEKGFVKFTVKVISINKTTRLQGAKLGMVHRYRDLYRDRDRDRKGIAGLDPDSDPDSDPDRNL